MAQSTGSRPGLDQPALLAALRARVSRLEGGGRIAHGTTTIPVCDGLGLPGNGLARATLHEILATEPGCGAAFAAIILARSGGTVVWIAVNSDRLTAWPPGLSQFGLLPANLILVRADGWSDALWAMEETLRCPAVSGALLAADWQAAPTALDLTASRRLQLAAEAGGGIGLLLQPAMTNPPPSVAASRWRIAPLNVMGPSHRMGDPCWQLELLRLRGGKPGGPWVVTWQAGQILWTAAARAAV